MVKKREESRITRRTKAKFVAAFKELLKNRSFEDVTVIEICDACDLTRPTFYSYFDDKYDLVLWTYYDVLERTVLKIGRGLTWSEAVQIKLEAMREEREFYSEVYKSKDDSALLVRDAQVVVSYYSELLRRNGEAEMSDHDKFLMQLYASGATRMTASWARTGMVRDPRLLTALYREAVPEFAKKALFTDQEYRLSHSPFASMQQRACFI